MATTFAGERLLTTKDLAEETGQASQTLIEWRRLGKGPKFLRMGRSIRYRESDVLAWLSDITDTPGGAA
ncbi:helix-turn-helix transcriptional regulator [Mycolicibacter kumamotonensis]|uniref:Helix-turn-helix domain-containing protein n=1 Tax=Mycolicibacter kumamotonensis TaxID=354243 RepID=A0A1B8SCM6_9MYCO|nr:helix-turn-helix domain-containing protein [Mycolicibacter kumamotonensis]OBY30498.1 hypothetical protein ACT18_17300 [Mycolicibacter kumamotonensis]